MREYIAALPARERDEWDEMVLLHAFKKQGQRTPRADLDLAFRRAREVLGGYR